MSVEITVYQSKDEIIDNGSTNIIQNIFNFSINVRIMYIILPISSVISIIMIWCRLFYNDSQCITIWTEKSSNISSYLTAVQFSLTATILSLIQHLYNYSLFQSISDTKTIIQTNIALSIVVPGLIGAGIGAGFGSIIYCGVGVAISSFVGFSLKNIWMGQKEHSNNTSVGERVHYLYLWQVQFVFLTVYTMTCIIIFSVCSTSRLGMYTLLLTPTRLVIIIPLAFFYLSMAEPAVFNPLLATIGTVFYQLGQTCLLYEMIPICRKINIACRLIAHLLLAVYVFQFVLRNIRYIHANRGSFNQDDLPHLILIAGIIAYGVIVNAINQDIYILKNTDTISNILLQRLYGIFFVVIYLSVAPSVAANSEINNMILEMSKSKAEENTKYQILSKVIPKNLFEMTLDQRTIPTVHYNVCVFYSEIGVVSTTNQGAYSTVKMINDINCVMNICMDLLNVNRVGSNCNSYLAEAGVAYVDSIQNNISIILNFALLVRESLKKIFNDNNYRIRMGINCGSCIGGLIETDYIPSFSLLGDMILAVKLVESKCDIGSILITENVMRHVRSNIVFSKSKNVDGKGIKSYVFDSFKKPKKYDDLVAIVESKYNKKQMPITTLGSKDDCDLVFNNSMKSLDGSDISDISYSDF